MTRSRPARIAIAATAVAGVLLATEALLRWLDLPAFDACSATADFAIPDPELGFAGAPGGVVAGETLNALGLRGPAPAGPKPEDAFRILFVGDSTCFGLGVPLDRAFPARATELVASDHPDRALDFVVAAFPGYSSYQSRIQLARLLPTSPDLVVLYVGARNDSNRHRYFPDADIPARRARLASAWHRVRVLRLVEALRDRLYKSVFRKLLSEVARARVPLDAFRANVADMARRLERARVPALVVVPPTSRELARQEPLADAYRDALRDVARAHHLPVVELQPAFEEAQSDDLYFDDGYHFAERGHAIAAREIRDAIDARGLVGR